MGEKKLEAGEFVYREGDTSDAVYTVASGKIEIIEARDGRDAQTAIIEPGKVFGELAVFDQQSLRPHSARALEASVLNSITSDEFQKLLAQCPKDIHSVLHHVFEKMRATKLKVKASVTDMVLESDITKITIAPDSDKLKALFKPIEIPLSRLPFRIGGYPEGGELSRRDQLHLSIASQDSPLRVSRQHCEIAIENKAVVIVDLGSRFCTAVNRTILGRGRGSYIAPLKKGPNELILGPLDGPYRLKITCA